MNWSQKELVGLAILAALAGIGYLDFRARHKRRMRELQRRREAEKQWRDHGRK